MYHLLFNPFSALLRLVRDSLFLVIPAEGLNKIVAGINWEGKQLKHVFMENHSTAMLKTQLKPDCRLIRLWKENET